MSIGRFAFFLFCVCSSSTWLFSQTNYRLTDNPKDQSETAVAVDPDNPNNVFVVWNDQRNIVSGGAGVVYVGYNFSTDGGTSWGSKNLVISGQTYPGGGDPSCAFDGENHLYYAYLGYNSSGATRNVCVTRFSVPGFSITHDQPLAATENGRFDKPYLAVNATSGFNNGRVYVTWTELADAESTYNSNTGALWYADLTSSGTVVNHLKTLDTRVGGNNYCTMPAVGADGAVYVEYVRDNGNGTEDLKVIKSDSGNGTFGSPVYVATIPMAGSAFGTMWANPIPSLAADPHDANKLYLIWMEKSDHCFLKFSRTTNAGTAWSTPVALSGLPSGNNVFPWVSVDGGGQAVIGFMNISPSDKMANYLVVSSDGSGALNAPVRISSADSSAMYCDECNFHFDYSGLSVVGETAHASWTDFRSSNDSADIYTAGFTVAPQIPSQISPSNGATGATPSFVWHRSTGAQWYRLEVYPTSTLTGNTTLLYSGSDTSVSGTGFQGNSTYYWRVRSFDTVGYSAWSSTYSFTTTNPTAPSLSSPSNGATISSRNDTSTWGSVSGASAYHIQLSTSSSNWSSPVYDLYPSGTSQVLAGLSYAITYYWRVSSIISGVEGAFSSSRSFITPAGIWLTVSAGAWDGSSYYPSLSWAPGGTGSSQPYTIYRSPGDSTGFEEIVSGQSGTSYVDHDVTISPSGHDNNTKEYYYIATSTLNSNNAWIWRYLSFEKAMVQTPTETNLKANYPNPFNPTTTISYELRSPGFVTIVIYNALGQELTRLLSAHQQEGSHQLNWNAEAAPSGTYLARITVTDADGKVSYSATQKMVLAR